MANRRLLSYIAGNMKDATNGGRNQLSFAEVAGTHALKGLAYTALYGKVNGWSLLGKPDVILGVLPLYGVQYLEIARSQDTLEFRSIEAEFLGHQKGGNLGIRVDCILDGTMQNTVANILWWMHLMGREEHDVNTNLTPVFTNVSSIEVDALSSAGLPVTFGGAQNTSVPSIQIENEEELYAQMSANESLHTTTPDDMKLDVTPWHKTFTLVTPHELVFDCFIETIVFSRDVKEGAKILKCTILLRQFTPPEYKLDERLALQATVGTDLKAKDRKDLTPEDWRNLKTVKVVKTQPAISPSKSKFKLFQSMEKVDFLINVAYRTAITATGLISNIQRQKTYNPRSDPIGRWSEPVKKVLSKLNMGKKEKKSETDYVK
jgi:hypothetical protein